jgi:hypothetical protein
MNVAIVTSENKAQLKALKKTGVMVHLISDESIEDFLLGKLAESAMKEKGEKKIGDPLQFMRKHGCSI